MSNFKDVVSNTKDILRALVGVGRVNLSDITDPEEITDAENVLIDESTIKQIYRAQKDKKTLDKDLARKKFYLTKILQEAKKQNGIQINPIVIKKPSAHIFYSEDATLKVKFEIELLKFRGKDYFFLLGEKLGQGGQGSVRKVSYALKESKGELEIRKINYKLKKGSFELSDNAFIKKNERWKKKYVEIEAQASEVKSLPKQPETGLLGKVYTYQKKDASGQPKVKWMLFAKCEQGKPLINYIRAAKGDANLEKGKRIFDAILTAYAEMPRVRRGFIRAHRDLKPENILIQEKKNGEFRVKFIDFGFAVIEKKRNANPQRASILGTNRYFAPEIRAKESAGFLYDEGKAYDARKVDVFSMGIILLELVGIDFKKLENRAFVDCYTGNDLIQDFLNGFDVLKDPKNTPLLTLLKKMLNWFPEDRISFEDLHQEFKIIMAKDYSSSPAMAPSFA